MVSEAEDRFEKMLMSQTPGWRLAAACRMFSTAKALIRAGFRMREGGEAMGWRSFLFLRLYGSELRGEQRSRILKHLESHWGSQG